MRRLLPLPAAAIAAVALLAGCGDSESSTSELAGLGPPKSVVFVEGAVQSTDAAATQSFIDDQAAQSAEPYEDAGYEGVEYKLGGPDDNAVGIVDDLLLITDGERDFKAAVDAADGESLADEAGFEQAISSASQGSLADVYVDVGALIDQCGNEIDPTARQALQNAGIDPSEATAVASLLPGTDQVEVQLSSDLGGEQAPSGDASELLGSLPSTSFAAFAVSGFGEQLQEAGDTLDEEWIPDSVPPNQLKNGLNAIGIDLDALTGSLQDAGAFAVGNSESRLEGALVLTTEGSEATGAISKLGVLLRGQGVPGVTALKGKASGFSVRDEELGGKPVGGAAQGGRREIGYGLAA